MGPPLQRPRRCATAARARIRAPSASSRSRLLPSRGSLRARRHLYARRGARQPRRPDGLRLGRHRRRHRHHRRPLRRPPRAPSRGERRARTCVRVRACGHMCGRWRRRVPLLLLRRCPGHAPGSYTTYPRRLPRRRRPQRRRSAPAAARGSGRLWRPCRGPQRPQPPPHARRRSLSCITYKLYTIYAV